MSQTRKGSLIEQVLNIASGFLIAMLLWAFVVIPYLGIQHNMFDNLLITSIFTIASLVRGYCWRRLFNNMRWFEG